MKTITTISELKKVSAKDNRAVVLLQLNKEVVDFLKSIHGKNRNESHTNIQTWISTIRNNEWSVDNCEMKVNASLTWLIEGHHRVYAVDAERAYGLCCKMIVIPDENAEIVFKNQDARGQKRNVGVQATLCGVKNAATWLAVERAWRRVFFADNTPSTVESVEKYIEKHADTIDKIDTRRKLSGDIKSAPALAVACLILAAERFPDKLDIINAFWGRVISGEMLCRSMPEYHLRLKYLHPEGITQKEMTWYTLKSLSYAIDGMELGVLKIVSSDNLTLSKRYGITSPKNGSANSYSGVAGKVVKEIKKLRNR